MDMTNWMSWAVILLAWLAIGLGVAYLFGRFVRGVETAESAKHPPSLIVRYLGRIKLNKTSLPMPVFPHTQTRH